MRLALCICLLITQGPAPVRAAVASAGLATAHYNLRQTFDRSTPQNTSAVALPASRKRGATAAKTPPGQTATKTVPASPNSTKATLQAAQPQNQGSFWKSLVNIGNAFWSLIKLAALGTLSITSNIIEGTINGLWALAQGRLADALASPIKTGLNVVANTLALAAFSGIVLADSFWQWIKPEEPRIDVALIGSGPRLRTAIIGGPLSKVESPLPMDDKIYGKTMPKGAPGGSTQSSGFVYFTSPDAFKGRDLAAHELAHTLQIKDSFLLDILIRRSSSDSAESIEKGAEKAGKNYRKSLWRFPGKFDKSNK